MKTINDVRKSLNALLEELDKMEAEQGIKSIPAPEWSADNLKVGDYYWWCRGVDGRPIVVKYDGSRCDFWRNTTSNIFETKEDAEYDYKMRKLAQSIRAQGFNFDWNTDQNQYSAFFDHEDGVIRFGASRFNQHERTYFKTKKMAQSVFEGVSNEDFIYMLDRGYV